MEGQISSLLRSRFTRLPGLFKPPADSGVPHRERPSRHRSRPSATCRPPSAAQQLPHELILQILGHLVPSVHTAAYRLPLEASNFTETLACSAAREVERSQRYLHWASQVCRSWHDVASELLYASPFLTTTRRMELFIRTVSEVPDLTRFIKDVYAPLTHHGKVCNLFGWLWGRRSAKAQREELASLLARCPSIEALTVRHSVKKSLASITPVDDVVCTSEINDKLKRLTVHGSSFEARWHPQFSIMPALSALPNLEVLCLRGIYILPTFQLPALPNLHTLQLVENYYFPAAGPRGPLFSQATMPKLRTVEIFRNHFAEATYGPVFDTSCFSQLECLHFVEDEHCLEVTRWADADSKVRHLALGFLHARDHVELVCWRFPDALESLTLLLRERDVPDSEAALGGDNSLEILDGVLHCIKLNIEEASSFKKLSVLAKFPGARNTKQRLERERVVDDIRQACLEKGVEFNYSLDAPDGWVAERLTRTHTHASMD
ncbi:hypothetical protein EIP86_004847 [Pleurotus ostreatoroseus]|nr:hypothetical protein EIP86_004847 [Pleurotus ostreatoroseus]